MEKIIVIRDRDSCFVYGRETKNEQFYKVYEKRPNSDIQCFFNFSK